MRSIAFVAFLSCILILTFAASSFSQKRVASAPGGECDFSAYAAIKMEHIPEEAVIRRVQPAYPRRAVELGIEGVVSVAVLVDETGVVRRACAFSGPRALQGPAEKAALGWRFQPKHGLAFSVQRSLAIKPYASVGLSFVFKLPE